MKDALRIAWYVVLALVTLARTLAAFPLILVWTGADVRGDEEMMRRLDTIIDRIIGTS